MSALMNDITPYEVPLQVPVALATIRRLHEGLTNSNLYASRDLALSYLMEAVRNCLGGGWRKGGRIALTNDEDHDPLLPTHFNDGDLDTNRAIRADSNGEPPASKMPATKNGSRRRFIDLEIPAGPGYTPHPKQKPQTPEDYPTGAGRSGLEKLVDSVAALSSGKMPTQDQINRILQTLLASDLLNTTHSSAPADGAAATINKAALNGTGPTSRRGRKVIQDVRGVIQALAEIGMEKNNDNILQDLIANLELISSGEVKSTLPDKPAIPSVKVDIDLGKAGESSKAALDAGKQGAEEVKDQIPPSKELANDTAILVHALRTLFMTTLTSSVFRFLLGDILSVMRDIAVQGVDDVKETAGQIESAASGVEDQLKTVDIGKKVDAGFSYAEAVVTGGDKGSHDESWNDVGVEALKLVEEAVEGVREVVGNVKQKGSEKGEEWKKRTREVKGAFKEDLVERVQQILVQAQEDPSSRNALRAILILVRKYADRIGEIGETVVEVVQEASQNVEAGVMGSVEVDINVEADVEKRGRTNYPPPSTFYPPVEDRNAPKIAGTSTQQPARGPFEAALLDLKVLLERSGKGYSLDGALRAFGRVVKDLNELPVDMVELLKDKELGSQLVDSGSAQTIRQAPRGKGSRGRKSKKGKKGKATLVEEPESHGSDEHEHAEDRTPSRHRPNIIREYFSALGAYLDRALDEPGWVTSKRGQGELQGLVEEGVALVNVVGEAVGDEIGEGVDAGNVTGNVNDPAMELRRRFSNDAKTLYHEIECYVAAVESDRTTMKLVRSFEALGASVGDLFGVTGSTKDVKKTSLSAVKQALRSSFQWTEWMAWGLPKLIKLMPIGAFPIPSMEAKSESGGWEAGLYALFVRGNAEARQRRALGRFSEREMERGSTVRGGVETTLVPDRVVVKEWTELSVDMSEANERELHPYSMAGPPPASRVERTSRIRTQIEGIRAKVDGLGYYFKYGGAWIGYEDEGIVNVDVGMDAGPYGGFGCDVEIEMSGERGPSPDEERQNRGINVKHGSAHPSSEGGSPLTFLGDGVEGEGEFGPIPEVFISGSMEGDEGEEANLDVQRALASDGAVGDARVNVGALKSGIPVSEVDNNFKVDPLFRVVDVQVEMRGVKVELEKSRHWILNKVLVQRLAGPAIGRAVKVLVQDEVKRMLEDMAMGLARVKVDAEARGKARKDEARRLRAAERRERVRRMVLDPNDADDAHLRELDDAAREDDDGSWATLLADWWFAMMKSGPKILQGRPNGEEEKVKTSTNVDVTSKGVVVHQETFSPEQSTVPSPAPMIYNKRTRTMEPVEGSENLEEPQSDITLAVGGEAQLFADKQVPYGARNDQGDFVSEGRRVVNEGKATANALASEALGTVAQASTRFNAARDGEKKRGWQSDAFDI